MLKRVLVNGKKVPVPVPVRTLAEALRWVEQTLVPPGHTITRMALDDRPIDDEATHKSLAAAALTDASKLEVQIDSPTELIVQTLDAMRNLAGVITGGLKVLAVACWQAKGSVRPQELETMSGDLALVLELLEHAVGLLDQHHTEVAALQGIAVLIKRAASGLAMAKANSDWRGCARLLLNRLEPLLKDLTNESESLQIRMLAQYGSSTARSGTF